MKRTAFLNSCILLLAPLAMLPAENASKAATGSPLPAAAAQAVGNSFPYGHGQYRGV